jgi:hypothetical protein
MIVTIIQGWKEGSKKINKLWRCLWPQGCEREATKKKLLWRCLWSRGALKFQIAFWAFKLTSTKNNTSSTKVWSSPILLGYQYWAWITLRCLLKDSSHSTIIQYGGKITPTTSIIPCQRKHDCKYKIKNSITSFTWFFIVSTT